MEVIILWLLLVSMACHNAHDVYDQLCLKGDAGFVRHPQDCQKFIRCHYQGAYEFQCPLGLLWHHEIKTCDFAYRTRCKLYDESQGANVAKFLQKNFETIFKENLSQYVSKHSKRVKRYSNSKRKCRKAMRENLKTSGNTVTKNKLISSPAKLTEEYKRVKPTLTEGTRESSKQKILNHNLINLNSTKFSQLTTKNISDTSTTNTSNITATTQTQNLIFPTTAEDNYLNLTETILSGYYSESFTEQQEKNFANFTETGNDSFNINRITEESSATESTAEYESTILTATYPETSPESSSKTIERNEIETIKPTESAINNDYLINSTQTTSVNVTDDLTMITEHFSSAVDLTDKYSVKTTEGKRDRNKSTTIHSENLLQNSTKMYGIKMTKYFMTESLNLTATKSSYLSQNLKQKFNTTSSALLQTTLKMTTVGSVTLSKLTDTSSVKTPGRESEYTSLTDDLSSFTDFETTAGEEYVNSTNAKTSTLNNGSTREGANFNSFKELRTSTISPDHFISISTVNSTDRVREYINANTTSTESSRESSNSKTLRDTTLRTTAEQKTVTLTEPTLADYPVENATLSLTQQKEINSKNSTASSEFSTITTDSLILNDYSTAKLEGKESENILLTPEAPLTFPENSTVAGNIKISKESELPTFAVNVAEQILALNTTFADNTTVSKIEGITEESDILQNTTTVRENSVSVTEDEHNSTKDEKENMYTSDGLIKEAAFSQQSSVTTSTTLTETVTENSNQHFNKMKPTEVTESFNNHHVLNTVNYKTVTHLTSESESTTSAILATLQDYFLYDNTTVDPRLPFRSIECRGNNNRRQLKAQKCFQYYQCFAGWAFLLNCHEGWRFQANKEQCVLDVKQECVSE